MAVIAMDIAKAIGIMQEIVTGRARWGKNFSVPYTMSQIYDAIVVIGREGKFDATDPAEVTKLRRQYAACQNREKARSCKIDATAGVDLDPTAETD